MKKMKNLKNIILFFSILMFFAFTLNAQSCGDFVNSQPRTYGYNFNTMSKSGTVKTGKKYKFVFTLNKGKVYRFAFFASSGLNNNMDFKITDQNSGQQILYLPGQVEEAPIESDYNSEGDYSGYDDYGDDNGDDNTQTKPKPKETTSQADKPDYKAIAGIPFKSVLNAEYYSEVLTYPFFEFKPVNSLNLEIIIDVKALEGGVVKKGCFAILVQDKAVEEEFQSIQ